jgi:SAM-dependent methyltransferase
VGEEKLGRRQRLGTSFNDVAGLYDEARPGYPTEIIDTIVARAALPTSGRILEIGCGTGQITLPLAARGYTIVALEPGDAMAALAARKCRPYPSVEIVPLKFEAWSTEPEAFDLVVSAQAFHWIEPAFGIAKSAEALKRGGALALVWHLDVSQATAFWKATQPIYDVFFPRTSAADTGWLVDAVGRYGQALRASEQFADPSESRVAWEKTYSGEDYLKLLSTFSDHRALSAMDRARFFGAIAETIDRAGGSVHRKYETVLLLAGRR